MQKKQSETQEKKRFPDGFRVLQVVNPQRNLGSGTERTVVSPLYIEEVDERVASLDRVLGGEVGLSRLSGDIVFREYDADLVCFPWSEAFYGH